MLPIRQYNGTADTQVKDVTYCAYPIRNAFAANGAPNYTFIELVGATHGETWDQAYADSDLWRWLFAQLEIASHALGADYQCSRPSSAAAPAACSVRILRTTGHRLIEVRRRFGGKMLDHRILAEVEVRRAALVAAARTRRRSGISEQLRLGRPAEVVATDHRRPRNGIGVLQRGREGAGVINAGASVGDMEPDRDERRWLNRASTPFQGLWQLR